MGADTEGDLAGRRAWRLVLAGTLVSSVGTGLTLPFLIVYLHAVLGASLPVAGLLVALSAGVGLVVTTVGGSVGDRVGLGRILVTGLLVQAGGAVLLGSATSLPVAVVALMLVGMGNALAWPALNGLIVGVVPEAERSRAYAVRFGVMNAGIGLGGIASGGIVALDDPGSFQLVYLLEGAATALFGILVAVGMREVAGFRPPPRVAGDRVEAAAGGYRAVLRDRAFVGFLLCSLVLGVFGYGQLDGPWSAYAALVAGSSPRTVGIAFAANTAVIVVAQLAVVRLTRRWRRSRLLLCACGVWAAAWAVTGVAGSVGAGGALRDLLLIVSLGVFGLGETFFSPVAGAMPNVLAPERLRARYNALASTNWSLGGLIGPPLAGLLLGSAVPAAWVVVIVAGTGLAAAGALALGRVLPAAADRPALEPARA